VNLRKLRKSAQVYWWTEEETMEFFLCFLWCFLTVLKQFLFWKAHCKNLLVPYGAVMLFRFCHNCAAIEITCIDSDNFVRCASSDSQGDIECRPQRRVTRFRVVNMQSVSYDVWIELIFIQTTWLCEVLFRRCGIRKAPSPKLCVKVVSFLDRPHVLAFSKQSWCVIKVSSVVNFGVGFLIY